MEQWKHLGAVFSGVAALITAFVAIFSFLKQTQDYSITKIQQIPLGTTSITQYAIINDPDGWTNLRSNPSIKSGIIVKIENGYRIEILEKNGNWYKIKTSLGDVGYIYSNRLQILK